MKGDFTRFTHDPAKRYSKVRKQQGRADVDADFNEQVDIQEHLDAITRLDVIGVTGFPKGPSFEVSVQPTGDIMIHPGRAYVDGLVAQLFGDSAIPYQGQPDLPEPPVVAPQVGRRDLVYLDVWERHLTAHQDPTIKEVALGGADTATRVQLLCQIRVQEGVGDVDCATVPFPPAPSGALMTTRLDIPAIPSDPCSPVPESAFRGLENRLYRVEIHQGGNLGAAQFKWSRDNGAVTFGVKQFRPNEPKRVELTRLGRDQMLTLKNGTWAEVLGDSTELMGNAGTLTQVDLVDNATRIVTFVDDVDTHDTEAHPLVRRWDGALQTAGAAEVELEDGIRVSFDGADFRVGDYWIFTTRTAEQGGLEILTDAPARGIRHHYAKLAIIEWQQNGELWEPVISDCRPQFPPLTNIDAEDVGFESDVCEFGPDVTNVQEALEALCSQEHECCTLVAVPGEGWEKVFDEIPPGGDAAICFRAGDYPVPEGPVVVAGRGHLKLTGVGAGSRLDALKGECAVRFQNCKSVSVRDLYARSRVSGTGPQLHDLNGALTFIGCDKVSLSGLFVECPNAPRRQATCLTIRNGFPLAGDKGIVEVEGCELRIGDEQVGVLVVNSRRAMIRNNRLVAKAVPLNYFAVKKQDFHARAGIVSALVSGISFGMAKPAEIEPMPGRVPGTGPSSGPSKVKSVPLQRATVAHRIGEHELRFATDKALVSAWTRMLDDDPPQVSDAKGITAWVKATAHDIVLGNAKNVPQAIKDWLTAIMVTQASSASQGITVAGRAAEEVMIIDNTIEGASQGIHVGLSHHDPARTNPDHGGRVVITGNRIQVNAVPGATRSRHAIFVGNADSIVVRDNYGKLSRLNGISQELPIDGIRLFGYFGRYINVRENHLHRFNIGVLASVRGTPANEPMWQIYDNFTAHASQAVVKNSALIKTSGNQS